MYTKAAVRATSATSLPMWGVEGSGMVLSDGGVFRKEMLNCLSI